MKGKKKEIQKGKKNEKGRYVIFIEKKERKKERKKDKK